MAGQDAIDTVIADTIERAAAQQAGPDELFAILDTSKALITRHLMLERQHAMLGHGRVAHVLARSQPNEVQDFFKFVWRDTAILQFYMLANGAVYVMLARDQTPGPPLYILHPLISPTDGGSFLKDLAACSGDGRVPDFRAQDEILRRFGKSFCISYSEPIAPRRAA